MYSYAWRMVMVRHGLTCDAGGRKKENLLCLVGVLSLVVCLVGAFSLVFWLVAVS